MTTRYRIIAFLTVLLAIVLLSCSCLPMQESFTEGNSCSGYTDGQIESQLDKCTRLYNSNLKDTTEWDNAKCDDVKNKIPGYSEGFALLNPQKVVDNEAQPYNVSNGMSLSSYNNLIIDESIKTPSNSSCLNHNMNMGQFLR